MTGHIAMADRTAGHSQYYEVATALQTALLGVSTRPAHGPLSNPNTASAFLPGSSVQAVDLGSQLWALGRKSPDDEHTVLCVYNVSDASARFDPTRYLRVEESDQLGLLFLSGAARSHGSFTAPIVELAAYSFVWLGHFSPDARPPDNGGETP